MDHQAAGAVAGPDDGAVAAAVERVGVGGEREAAFPLVLAVALEAGLLEDRLDLSLVVDARARCGRLTPLPTRGSGRR